MANHSEHVETLIRCADQNVLAVLHYRKGVTSASIRPRLVEPYAFREGAQDLMIKCYQLEHDGDGAESGWRFFMSHKIDRAEPTTIRFRPRRKITITSGEVSEASKKNESWDSEGRRLYRDLVGDAMADGFVAPAELLAIEQLREKYKLTDEDIRFVHATVYHRCLGAVTQDGFLADEEVDQIRFLHRVMKALGWSVGD